VVALVCLYAAGNYFVVREASVAMFNLNLAEGQSIPFGWLFWIFTVAIPIACIVRGLQNKDAVLLRVGLLLVAAIVFTVRYYYHMVPAETAMVIGGMIFIVLAYALIKYLHEPKYGFTYKEQQDKFFMDKLQVESLVIAQTFAGPAAPSADSGTQFGGGSGSGGGAGAEF
jgi:Ca2+/Na+ antiporter